MYVYRLKSPEPAIGLTIDTGHLPEREVSYTVMRTDANGTRPVRLSGRPTAFGGTRFVPEPYIAIYDYEPAFGTVSYTVEFDTGDRDSGSMTIEPAPPALIAPLYPIYSGTIGALIYYEHEASSSTAVVDLPFARSPHLAPGLFHSPKIRLTALCSSYNEAKSLEGILSCGHVLFLRQPDHSRLDQYFIATRVRLSSRAIAGKSTTWQVQADGIQTEAPEGYVITPTHGTYQIVQKRYARYMNSLNMGSVYATAFISGV